MCGRYVATTTPSELGELFGAAVPPDVEAKPSWNVAPTQDVLVVLERPEGRALDVFRWGLVPLWAADVSVGARMINARAESLATKGAFRPALERRRCLIPADGFYEWRRVTGTKRKQPFFIHRPDGRPLAFAGLWERWRPKGVDDPPTLHTCTIVTTAANATLSALHDRMPVVLDEADWAAWLDPGQRDVDALGPLLRPAAEDLLVLDPVSTAVNDVRNDGPELLDPPAEPIASAPEPTQPTLPL